MQSFPSSQWLFKSEVNRNVCLLFYSLKKQNKKTTKTTTTNKQNKKQQQKTTTTTTTHTHTHTHTLGVFKKSSLATDTPDLFERIWCWNFFESFLFCLILFIFLKIQTSVLGLVGTTDNTWSPLNIFKREFLFLQAPVRIELKGWCDGTMIILKEHSNNSEK